MRFTIRFTPSAVEDLREVPAFHQRQILDAIARSLAHEPLTPSRNRKLIEGMEPPWDASAPFWELRVGPYRVFYDAEDESVIAIRAVRRKPAGKTTKEIL